VAAIVAVDLTPLCSGSRFRGIGTYAFDLATAMAAAPPDDMDLRFLVGGVADYELWPVERALDRLAVIDACGGDEQVSYQRYYHAKRTTMRRFLDDRGVALYHATDPKGTTRDGAYRTVITAHDLIGLVMGYPYRLMPAFMSRAMERRRYGGHDHVISISEWTKRDLQAHLGLTTAPISVVHHGVDARFRVDEAAPAPQRPYFLYVGGFDVRKQVPQLIEAFGRVKDRVAEDLVITGRPKGGHKTAIEQAAVRAGLGDRLKLPGFVPVDQLPGLYGGATAHLLPTLYEGFGMTALEAMASGCPVLTLNASCVPEICGDAAEYAEPGDWTAYDAAMVRVSTDEPYREGLRTRGLARAATFTWARAAEQTLQVYRAALAR